DPGRLAHHARAHPPGVPSIAAPIRKPGIQLRLAGAGLPGTVAKLGEILHDPAPPPKPGEAAHACRIDQPNVSRVVQQEVAEIEVAVMKSRAVEPARDGGRRTGDPRERLTLRQALVCGAEAGEVARDEEAAPVARLPP